jgi:hypothetical protein
MYTHGEILLKNHSLECGLTAVTDLRIGFWSNKNVGTVDLYVRFYVQI